MINVFAPTVGQAELHQIADSFSTGWLGKGRKVAEFEAAWAAHVGATAEHIVSTTCATEGLFQVCDLIGLNSGDKVIMPSISFIGAANAVMATGAQIAYCDVDPRTLNPTLDYIAAKHDRYVRAVILLHYGGVASELDDIRAWCDERDVILIEDAACAQATMYEGKAAGTWGHYGVWSFDAMKVITTGDGGMVYCENTEDAERLRRKTYLGMDTATGLGSSKDKWWEFRVKEPGQRRAVMNDIAAGIGLEQLKQLPIFVNRRKAIADRYDVELYDAVKPPFDDTKEWPYYFYWIQTPDRDALAAHLKANGIYTTFRYYPLHWVFKAGDSLPNTEHAAKHTLLLPLHQGLSDQDVAFVCEKVKEFFR